ncbi:hypothetical protein [Mycolicibacterium sp.]|uniref:hypothetical protein n=1 Tax=Mycolicibacterium sp. TaxID=2320850 RepID=UPI0037CA86E4
MTSHNLARMNSWLPMSGAGYGLSRNQSRVLSLREGEELINGLVAAAHINALGYVTWLATQTVGGISRDAELQNGGYPKSMGRVDMLLDQCTLSAGRVIGRM